MLRFDSPLHLFERTATADVEIGGVTVRQGQKVAALLGSANRDAEVFDRADELDVGRDPNPHLAFGAGIHFCLGAPLARLELQTSLPLLVERFPDLHLVGGPRCARPSCSAATSASTSRPEDVAGPRRRQKRSRRNAPHDTMARMTDTLDAWETASEQAEVSRQAVAEAALRHVAASVLDAVPDAVFLEVTFGAFGDGLVAETLHVDGEMGELLRAPGGRPRRPRRPERVQRRRLDAVRRRGRDDDVDVRTSEASDDGPPLLIDLTLVRERLG